MSEFWRHRKVLVTGGSGFIGSHVVDRLVSLGAQVTATVFQNAANLDNLAGVQNHIRTRVVDLTRLDDCLEVCRHQDVVLSIAHADGSVAFKKNRPGYILRQNMLITLNMLEAASRSGVERVLITSSAEVYPLDAPVPTPEPEAFRKADRLSDGYAWSKRMSEVAAQIWTQEYGTKVAIARPNNIYGPRDYFDEEKGRVIPMFIKNALRADRPILIWGTGETVRSFLFVEDLARGFLELIEKYPQCDPVNFGGDEEVTLRTLAETVVRLTGSKVEIVCDLAKPSGAAKRTTDIAKAQELLGFRPTVPLEAGLSRTIEAYLKQVTAKKHATIH